MTQPQVVRAKARLDRLDWYPRPVGIGHVRDPARRGSSGCPGYGSFDGYALHRTILVRDSNPPDDLVVHELCHVWQMQHHPVAMPLSYLRAGYGNNPYERQARAAVEQTQNLSPSRSRPRVPM